MDPFPILDGHCLEEVALNYFENKKSVLSEIDEGYFSKEKKDAFIINVFGSRAGLPKTITDKWQIFVHYKSMNDLKSLTIEIVKTYPQIKLWLSFSIIYCVFCIVCIVV